MLRHGATRQVQPEAGEKQTVQELARAEQPLPRARNTTFDLLRLLFACLVLLAHSDAIAHPEHGNLFQLPVSLGAVGVDGFFLLSGYLIVRSWLKAPDLLPFLQKRVLRIVPGYAVAVVLSVLVVGTFAPATDHFFRGLHTHFLASVLLLSAPDTPRVFPRLEYGGVNGSLWTIAYEFRCYLLVAAFGMLRLLRMRWPWLVLTAVTLALNVDLVWQGKLHWTGHYLVTGDPNRVFQLLLPFLIGGCFGLYRRIPFHPLLMAFATVAFATSFEVPWGRDPHHYLPEPGLVLFGGYLLFALGRAGFLRGRSLPDISYGTYLYGWPVQCFWISLVPGTTWWLTFAVSVPMSLLFGWLSWHFVERPALQWKWESTAALPSS